MINRIFWTLDTRSITPKNLQFFRGEDVELDIELTSYGEPVDLAGAGASAFWRSPDMASGFDWYGGPAEVSGNRVTWTWTGANDSGASAYEFYVGVDASGLSYRPCGKIQMLGSPSLNPSAVPIVPPVLDFDKYTVLHAPYYTKAETLAEVNTIVDSATSALASVEYVDGAIDAATSAKADTSALVAVSGAVFAAVDAVRDSLSAYPTTSAVEEGWWTEWTIVPEISNLSIRFGENGWTLYQFGIHESLPKGDENSTFLSWQEGIDAAYTVSAYRHRVASPVPVKTSDLTNDSAYTTSAEVDSAITSAIDASIGTINTILDAINGEVI